MRRALLLAAAALAAAASAQDAPPAPEVDDVAEVEVVVVTEDEEDGDAEAPDPTKAEVPLPAREGWHASLVHESDVGVWTVGTVEAFPDYGCPEVFGLDDKGRCTVLASYSGKWTPHETVHDVKWLGALVDVDLDASIPGRELYVGGQRGNLYQIKLYDDRTCETRVVARLGAEEIHTLVAGDLDPTTAGDELLAFARTGKVWRAALGDGLPQLTPYDDVGARIRQAALMPCAAGERPWILAACRCGELFMLRVGRDGLERRVITSEAMGLGRLAIAPDATAARCVVYVTRDDGVILRCEGEPGADGWTREVVYAGPQGPRGLVAGRFSDAPDTETLATFGYSGRVQLLTRTGDGPWSARTIFEDRDKGHWLAVAELDGRNATDELLASGYGKRIVLLSRPPGFGLDGVPTDPDPGERASGR